MFPIPQWHQVPLTLMIFSFFNPNRIWGMSVNEKGAIIDRPLERESFYIPLKWEAMKKMQVVLGPKAGEGERAIVDALLYKIFQDDHDIDVKKSVVRIR